VLATPALVLDAAALDRNLAAMQRLADRAGAALRPHVKGHKSPWIAARQIRAGAVGLAAATLDEAEGMLRAGVAQDVLVTSDLPPHAAGDVAALARLGDLAVVADDTALVEALAATAASDRPLRVFVDLDIGQHRGGAIDPVGVATSIAQNGLRLGGVQAYEGHAQLLSEDDRRGRHTEAMQQLAAILTGLRAAGHQPPVVTSAGTGTASLAFARSDLVTEIQPGSYALMDHTYARAGADFEQALHIVSAVRSRRADGSVVIDAGLKAASIDMGKARPADLDARYAPAGDEHGILDGAVGDLKAGDLVRLIPSHSDTTIRLHRSLWLDGLVELPLV
jgi:D-serine deaminase-like pyridoxal phosphate-dependent protein